MVGLILKIVINYKNSVSFSGINYDKRKKVLLKLTEQPNVWYTMIYKNSSIRVKRYINYSIISTSCEINNTCGNVIEYTGKHKACSKQTNDTL